MSKKIFLYVFIILCMVFESVSFACTDFQVKAKDGSVIKKSLTMKNNPEITRRDFL